MSRRDTIERKYMINPEHFADFFNGYIYNGEEVIMADDLQEVDTTNIAVIPYDNSKKVTMIQKYRDVLKKCVLMKSKKMYYLYMGIENQTEIHYAMPVKNMLYDSLLYSQQVEALAKYNRDNKEAENSAEFLSGFRKDDKLIPIVTATVYWGDEPWDGPVNLKSMFDELDEDVDILVNDYNCNLFSIIDAEKLPVYRTELGELFNVLRLRNSKDEMYNLVNTNSAYENIDRDTAIMMKEFASFNVPRRNKEGKYNMCKAIEELKRDSADEALIKAIINMMNNTKESFEEICTAMGINKTDMERYRKMI